MKAFVYPTILIAYALFISCNKDDDKNEAIVFSASGNINSTINDFRQKLGVLNTTTGNTTGRREINWDAIPDSFELVNLPENFFNPTGPGANVALQRGFEYQPGAGARVSAGAFENLEPSNATQFEAFSGTKTFATVDNNLWNVEFEVAGEPVPAAVQGFGAVFSDVDTENGATMQFFAGTECLGIFKVPVRTNGSLSFLGVYFPDKKITRIEIKQGSAPLGSSVKDISAGGTHDLVLMDDFIYSEPVAN